MEVSPLLVDDAKGTVAAAMRIFKDAARPNFFVKIPGTAAGLAAIEETIFKGVPVNVTLLFSREQYLAAADAYMRGIERRLEAGLEPDVASVASLFVSRWDKAVRDRVPTEVRNRLGLAVAGQAYAAYRGLLESDRWQRLEHRGAAPQKLLWASTGTKDPDASDCLYVEALVAPGTIDTVPEKTLRAFVAHGQVRGTMTSDGVAAEDTLAQFARAGIDVRALAQRLQIEGAESFAKSWGQLMTRIAHKRSQWIAA
jgi:transaldolase